MNAHLPILLSCLPLFVACLFGCKVPTSQKAPSETPNPSPTTQPNALNTFEVLEVRGKVRGSLNEANPRIDSEWFKVCPGDLLLPDTFVHIPFRGQLKVSRRADDPRTVILLDSGLLGRLDELVLRPRVKPGTFSFCFRDSRVDTKPIPELPCSAIEEDHRYKYSDRCSLHDELMPDDFVPIEYGLIRVDLSEMSETHARFREFPNSNRSYRGGCVGRPAMRALVRFCPKCRDAEEKWRFADQERTTTQPSN